MVDHQRTIKENIQQLINMGQLIEAVSLIEEYEKIVLNDIELISMKAIIGIMNHQLDEARDLLLCGLEQNPFSFDLLFNLAYVYQQQQQYCQAVIYYKKAKQSAMYNIELRIKAEEALDDLYKNNKNEIIHERQRTVLYKQLETINKVLFIDFNVSAKTNYLAGIIANYAIDVDLVYFGRGPSVVYNSDDLPYRKMISFLSFESLVEYIRFYQYDNIHIFDAPTEFKQRLKDNKISIITGVSSEDYLSAEKLLSLYIKERNKSKLSKLSFPLEIQSDITMIIPTHNRPDYLKRCLMYFETYQTVNFKIIVLDSSTAENKELNKKTCKLLKKFTIEYFQFDQTNAFMSKMHFGMKQVQSEFVCFCADDDFIVEEGIIEALKKFKADKELFSVRGKNLYYIKTMAQLTEYDFFASLSEEEPIRRLEEEVKGGIPNFAWQISRADKYKIMYDFINDNFKNFPLVETFCEYLIHFIIVLTGKVESINVDFNVRDQSVQRASQVKNFPHAIIEGTFNEEYNSFKKNLVQYGLMLHISGIQDEGRVDRIFSAFLKNFLQIPAEYICVVDGMFDLEKLKIGMRKSWVWPNSI